MPQRVCNSVEKDVVAVPTLPVVVADSVSTNILPDITTQSGEYAQRAIQNVGANDAFYAFGRDCKSDNYDGVIAKPGTGTNVPPIVDASVCGQRVSVFSVGGTTIACKVFKRNDVAEGTGGIM